MARVDKTHPAVGVVRAALAADIAPSDYDKVFAVGLDAQGRIVKGAGNTGIIGVINPSRTIRRAGQISDIFVLGDFVDCAGLVAGTKYYGQSDGTITTTNTGTYIGFTVEADRLVVRL